MKRCSGCNKELSKDRFNKRVASPDGLQNICRDCQKLHRSMNKASNKEYHKRRYALNRDKILSSNKLWNQQNKDKIRSHKASFKIKNPEYYKTYCDKNKLEISKKKRQREKIKRETDPIFKLKQNYRNRLYDYYKGTNRSKTSQDLIGVSWEEFKIHIESLFQKDMSWDNYGEWHIDHVVPLCSASSEEELEKLFHYSNCQPLWRKDNLSKGSRVL